jgi:transcription elongation factor
LTYFLYVFIENNNSEYIYIYKSSTRSRVEYLIHNITVSNSTTYNIIALTLNKLHIVQKIRFTEIKHQIYYVKDT